jgi:2-polyprenyl-3-methyl-5-hydroxy-6-metoxy-1,4-benzoquinol methylase
MDWALKGNFSMVESRNAEPGPQALDYDGYSEWKNWTKFFQYSADDASYFERELGGVELRNRRLLEIGFGEGRFLGWARDRGALVTGMERDANALAAARKDGVSLIDGDLGQHSKALRGQYAVIAAFDVFEHLTLTQIEDYLAAAAQLLEPNGILILRYPNGQSPFGLPQQHGDVTHLTALSRAKIDQLASPYGLHTIRYGAAAIPRGNGLVWLARSSRRLARWFLGKVLNFAFNQNIVWDAVVTQVLQLNRTQNTP